MKKIISFILVFTLVLSCAGLTFSQATDASLLKSASYSESTTETAAVIAYKTLSVDATAVDNDEEPVTEDPTEDPGDTGDISFFQGIIVALKAAFGYISDAWNNLDNNGGTAALMDAVFDALKATGLDVDGFYNWFLSSGVLQWFAQIFLK